MSFICLSIIYVFYNIYQFSMPPIKSIKVSYQSTRDSLKRHVYFERIFCTGSTCQIFDDFISVVIILSSEYSSLTRSVRQCIVL